MARIPPVDDTCAPPASGERRTWLFCHAISTLVIDAGLLTR